MQLMKLDCGELALYPNPMFSVSVWEDSEGDLCEKREWYLRVKMKNTGFGRLSIFHATSTEKSFNRSYIFGFINYPPPLLIMAVMLSKYSASVGSTGILSLQ